MNPRFAPEIQEALEKFLKKYKCFHDVFNQLSWIKSTDYMAVKGQAAPCWVQYSNYKTYVVLNEEFLLNTPLKKYISWCACHEVLHVVKSHSFRFRELPQVLEVSKKRDLALRSKNMSDVRLLDDRYKKLMKVWNMAADMSINSMFGWDETPPGCLLPGHYGFPGGESAEDYFDRLLDKAQQQAKKKEERKNKDKDKDKEGGGEGKCGDGLEDLLDEVSSPKTVRVKVKKQKPSDKADPSSDDGEKSEGEDVSPSEGDPKGKDESESSEGGGADGDKEKGSGKGSENNDCSGGEDSEDGASGTPGGEGGENSSGGSNKEPSGNEEEEVDEVTECTCGTKNRYMTGYKPCVHEINMGEQSKNPGGDDSEEDEFDPGEALRQAMESGFKKAVKNIKIKKRHGQLTKEDFDPNNYKKVLAASRVSSRYGGLGKAHGGPSDFECSIIDQFTEVNPFKWERLLSNFLKTGSKISVKFARRKRDRRFGTRPGLQIVQKKHVAFVLDTSGSMSTEKIMSCKSMIDSLNEQMDVTLIQCDHVVRHCEKWTSRDFIKLKGGGGTSFYPAIKTCEYLKVDGMVYYTDGQASDPHKIQPMKKPNFDTLWLLVDVRRYGLHTAVSCLPNWGRKLVVD